MRILNYNEFSALNESFQSNKLKDIINQHGKPAHKWDYAILHDLQDSEVAGVMTADEWYKTPDKDDTFGIELKDGYRLIIRGVEKLKPFILDRDKDKAFADTFKERRDARHQGNEFNGVPEYDRKNLEQDRFQKHFKEQKDKLIHDRNVEAFKSYIGEAMPDFIKSMKDGFDAVCEDKIQNCDEFNGKSELEFEVEFNNNTYEVLAEVDCHSSESSERYGAKYYDMSIAPISFKVYDEETEDEFEMKELTDDVLNLYDDYNVEDVEGGITDPYEYYGVSRSDFF